jgi:hypothetical protein
MQCDVGNAMCFHYTLCILCEDAIIKNRDEPRFVIQNWMRNRNTIEFLGLWEELHNPNFNRVQFEAVRSEAGYNRFVMTPTKWISPEFQLYIMKDYRRLKSDENSRLSLGWKLNREIAKLNVWYCSGNWQYGRWRRWHPSVWIACLSYREEAWKTHFPSDLDIITANFNIASSTY